MASQADAHETQQEQPVKVARALAAKICIFTQPSPQVHQGMYSYLCKVQQQQQQQHHVLKPLSVCSCKSWLAVCRWRCLGCRYTTVIGWHRIATRCTNSKTQISPFSCLVARPRLIPASWPCKVQGARSLPPPVTPLLQPFKPCGGWPCDLLRPCASTGNGDVSSSSLSLSPCSLMPMRRRP